MAKYIGALLTPWRPAFRTHADKSGLRFWVQPYDAVGRHIAKYGRYEPALTDWIDQHLRASPPGLFIDVGANIGWHTLHAAQHANVVQVVAFEPDAFNAWLLDRNLGENAVTNTIVLGCAIGAASGTAQLYRYKASNYGRHSLVTDHGHGSRTVPVATIDIMLDQLGLTDRSISLIKIDVEGYEPAVIAGAEAALNRTAAIVTEYSPDLSPSEGATLELMLEQLDKARFVPHHLTNERHLVRLSLSDLRSVKFQTDIVWRKV